MFELLFLLLCGHALADFALQSEAMTKGKNRHNKPDYIPAGQKYCPCWFYWLTAHALIHGLIVTYFMPIDYAWIYGLTAMGIHWVIDFLKCEGWFTPHFDQFCHFMTIICIILYFNYI